MLGSHLTFSSLYLSAAVLSQASMHDSTAVSYFVFHFQASFRSCACGLARSCAIVSVPQGCNLETFPKASWKISRSREYAVRVRIYQIRQIASSRRQPVQNPKLRYFKPFEFFDHALLGVPPVAAHTGSLANHRIHSIQSILSD